MKNTNNTAKSPRFKIEASAWEIDPDTCERVYYTTATMTVESFYMRLTVKDGVTTAMFDGFAVELHDGYTLTAH